MKPAFLGGMTALQFLRDYWQKQPLLIRGAFPPGIGGALTPDELAGLACEEAAQSRLVLHQRGKWRVEEGPFDEARFAQLPARGWSLLVQGVNHFLPEADALLQAFDFIPRARLDDVMVSFAPDGGGVGPHFDSYDVFLLQGHGRRLWRVSSQDDRELVPDAPLRILKNFHTEQEWVLEPGDMLYLPPRLAHWGIAVGDCMTWSVGFRAPSAQELATEFLAYLQDRIALDGMYADPDLRVTRTPAEIGPQMLRKVAQMLRRIRWSRDEVADFLGSYLTEPKPHVIFDKQRRSSLEAFAARVRRHGLRLDPRTQMLYSRERLFINGEALLMDAGDRAMYAVLADGRVLPADAAISPAAMTRLQQWYEAGYLELARD